MRRIAWVIVPIVLVGLLGLAVFAARGPGATTAFTLVPGDCFDIPADAQIGDIPTLDCAKPHDAEVFVAVKMIAEQPTAGPVAYPGAGQIAVWVENNCGLAAEEAYLGAGSRKTGLVVGYFFPDADAWAHGQQQVTCYLHTAGGSKLTTSVRSAGTGPSASPS